MGVTIDSLQIEIQSSSTNAASGIDALAASLERLKKNGSFKTATTNLERLSNALRGLPNVHGASNALRTLANSIEKLKSVGSVASLTKSLAGLPVALKALEGINLDGVASKAERLAVAVGPLSSIKAGGLGSMVTAMSKLAKVTESLSEEALNAFAEKIKKLDDILGPVSQKMTTLQSGFKGLNTVIKQTNTSIDHANIGVKVGIFNFANLTTVLSSVVGALQSVAQGFANVIDSAAQWDGIAARFGRGFGAQAQETYEWIQRLNEEMGINVQQFMQYSSIYATMLTGFGVANKDASKMALGYAELTYDIWAGYNDIYRSFDEAAEAVRSAIAGEVEPIRRAGFTIIESTLEQTAANHGLEISLENATEAQKSYLRYLTLVDQAHSQSLVGTYAKEMNTAEGLMRTLSQQLKSLGQAFGSLFIPMLVKALPYVQAFVELLTDGVFWIAELFGIKIQDISGTWGNYNSGISDAVTNTENVAGALDDATSAAKALKNASLGIDELNVISPSSSTGGGGGIGGVGGGTGFDGLDVDSLWDESIFDSVQSKVDELKSKLKGVFEDWLPQIKVIGTALGAWGIAKLLEQLGEALDLGDKFSGVVTNIKKLATTAIIVAIQFKLMDESFGDFMGEDGTILDYIEGILIGAASTYLLYKTWGAGGLAIGLGVTAIVSLKAVMEEGGITDMESATVALTGLAAGIGAVVTAIKPLKALIEYIKGAKIIQWLGTFIGLTKEAGFINALAAAFPKIASAFSSLTATISSSGGVWAALKGVITQFGSKLGWVGAIIIAVASAIDFLVKNWEGFTQAIKAWWGANISPKLEEIKGHIDTIKEAFTDLGVTLKPVFDALKPVFDWLKNAISWLFEFVGGTVVSSTVGATLGLVSSLVQAFEGIVQWVRGVAQIISGIFEFISGIFTLNGEKIATAAKKIVSGVGDVFGGLWSAVALPIYEFFKGVIDWFVKLWDELVGHSIVPDTIDAIVEWFVSLPGKIFKSIENFVNGIITRFKGMWSKLVSWWNSKTQLKEYTPSIGSIFEKLKARWDNARTWWNEKKTAAKQYTPSIGSIYEKISDRWKNARDWWNNKKAAMKSYTPSIGSIVDKIKSAWSSAKSWWNKNVGGLSTKLDVKVPKIKVKWDTASAFGKSFKYPTGFKLEFAADGGVFDAGSLVWAGERGPEIVANASGGRTGVMNVQQMQEAVYEGVYSAIVAAMSGRTNDGERSINVYLDGRQIAASVEKHQRERGASIMGNEVYSY